MDRAVHQISLQGMISTDPEDDILQCSLPISEDPQLWFNEVAIGDGLQDDMFRGLTLTNGNEEGMSQTTCEMNSWLLHSAFKCRSMPVSQSLRRKGQWDRVPPWAIIDQKECHGWPMACLAWIQRDFALILLGISGKEGLLQSNNQKEAMVWSQRNVAIAQQGRISGGYLTRALWSESSVHINCTVRHHELTQAHISCISISCHRMQCIIRAETEACIRDDISVAVGMQVQCLHWHMFLQQLMLRHTWRWLQRINSWCTRPHQAKEHPGQGVS